MQWTQRYKTTTCYYIRWKLSPYCYSYHLQACHHGCWLHSSGSLSGHFGWSLQEWQAGERVESGQWGNCVGPGGTCGHKWSGFLQQDTKFHLFVLHPGHVGAVTCALTQSSGPHSVSFLMLTDFWRKTWLRFLVILNLKSLAGINAQFWMRINADTLTQSSGLPSYREQWGVRPCSVSFPGRLIEPATLWFQSRNPNPK